MQFEVVGISDIRETDDYPGIRVALKANYPPISVPLTVDVTTGDMITPREVEYTFSLLFDDRTISILAYNLETVLAEKLETVLSRNIANTRPRDYYDVHILYALRGAECDKATLRRSLERISLSPYKNNFILKGGFLISAIVGLDTRATMDLDTTIKGFTLTHEAIRKIFTEICAVQIADDVQFEVVGISDIRETDDYPGIRVALKANYSQISVPLTVDVTTGDMITPREVEYTFSLLFDDRTISILAYNLETVLAEKLETVLSRNIANTRPRDYYDVHILYALRGAECDKATLRRALERTTQKRGSGLILTDYPEIMKEIRESDTLRKLWEKYSREYEYAKDISFDDTCTTIQTIMDAIML